MEFIVIAILIFIAGGYLFRWLFRLWLGRRMREFQQQMGGTQDTRRTRPAREGEVKVDRAAAPRKKVNERIGDYVDFEEVAITDPAEETHENP